MSGRLEILNGEHTIICILTQEQKKWLSSIGTGNVLIEEVDEFDNEVDALKYEDELILKYDTITNGYNKRRSGLIKAENPKEYKREYRKTEKYKEYQKEYRKTEKYKEYQKQYREESLKNYNKEYRKIDKYREYQKNYQKKYQQTEKYKDKRRERRKTDEYREYERAYKRDHMQAKKLGISIDEYRKLKKDQAIQLTINF